MRELNQIMMNYAVQIGTDIANKLYVRYTPDVAQEVKACIESDEYVQEECEELVKCLVCVLRDYTYKYITERIAPDLLKGDNNDIHTVDGPTNNGYKPSEGPFSDPRFFKGFDPDPLGH